jgi:hypothetical protein
MRRRGTVSVYWDITDLKQRERDLTEKFNSLAALTIQFHLNVIPISPGRPPGKSTI